MWFTLILTGLVCLATYHASAFNIICEGNQAEISFHYAQSNVSITLQYRNRYPFYSDGKMLEAGLSGDQIKRFQVEEIHEDGLLVVVKIVNVSREDAGTYIAFAREDRASEESSMRRKSLDVEYPPGKPLCRSDLSSNIDIISDVWDIIKCTAEIGNIPGYIVCFQDDQPLPPQNYLTHGTLTLSQKIWVKKDQGFLCCTLGYKDPFKRKCSELQPVIGHVGSELSTDGISSSPSLVPNISVTPSIGETNQTTENLNRYADIVKPFPYEPSIIEIVIVVSLFYLTVGVSIAVGLLIWTVKNIRRHGNLEVKDRRAISGENSIVFLRSHENIQKEKSFSSSPSLYYPEHKVKRVNTERNSTLNFRSYETIQREKPFSPSPSLDHPADKEKRVNTEENSNLFLGPRGTRQIDKHHSLPIQLEHAWINSSFFSITPLECEV